MKVTGKYSIKPYKCTGCGQESEHGTNHWGDIYPNCPFCMGQSSVLECLEELPEGYKKPEKWRQVKLGDFCKIVRGGNFK